MNLKISNKLGDYLYYKNENYGVSMHYEEDDNNLIEIIKLLIKQEQDFAITFEKEEDKEK